MTPYLSQLIPIYRLGNSDIKSYGIFSAPGAGKTASAIWSSVIYNCKLNIIVCPNSVKADWKKEILNCNPNVKETNIIDYKSLNDIVKFNKNEFNYIIINYDKFSIKSKNYGKSMVDKFISLNEIDMFIFDELHKCKISNPKHISNRNECLTYFRQSVGNDTYVLSCTGTPCTSNPNEVKSILEIQANKSFDDITNNIRSSKNIINTHSQLILNGWRYIPDYNISKNDITIEINGEQYSYDIYNAIKLKKQNVLEGLLTKIKLNNEQIIKELTPGTVIYTEHKKHIINEIENVLNSYNLTYVFFTGDEDIKTRRDNLNKFKNNDVDILIGTSSVGTGVDGIQKISNKIIYITYPFDFTNKQQIDGRIYRRGSNFDKVKIITPSVYVELPNGKWSYDEKRLNAIEYKKRISDAITDGKYDKLYTITERQILIEACNDFKIGFENINLNNKDKNIIKYSEEEYKKAESIIKDIHQKANTTSSEKMHEYFTNNPSAWINYHNKRDINKSTWVEDPVDVIGEIINSWKQDNVIADMGCGLAKLSNIVKSNNKVISVDHYSENPDVIQCDMSHTPIKENSIDCVVFCLSLWGTNYLDYIKEAYRIAAKRGFLYICEPVKKERFNSDEFIENISNLGFEHHKTTIRNEFIYYEFIKN